MEPPRASLVDPQILDHEAHRLAMKLASFIAQDASCRLFVSLDCWDNNLTYSVSRHWQPITRCTNVRYLPSATKNSKPREDLAEASANQEVIIITTEVCDKILTPLLNLIKQIETKSSGKVLAVGALKDTRDETRSTKLNLCSLFDS